MAKKKTEEKKSYSSMKPASFRINERLTVECILMLDDAGEPARMLMAITDNKTGKAINIEENL